MLRSMSDELPIINKVYDFYKQLSNINEKLPKTKKHSLGISTESTAMELLEYLVMAKQAPKPHKATYLLRSQAKLEVLRLKLRLYLELELASSTRIMQQQAALKEVGKMLGGWYKSLV